jgi:protein LSM14
MMTGGYIGSKISLISRSDIRYVGILHSINSQDSTVSLEQVRSFGTEGRRANPADEIPPTDTIYDYIVFRGSDVKDLHVCEAPAPQQSLPPQVPNDPAILGTTAPRPSFQGFGPPPPLNVQPPPNFPGAHPYYLGYQQPQQFWQQPPQVPQQPQVNLADGIGKEAEKPKPSQQQQTQQPQKEHAGPDKPEDHKVDQFAQNKNFGNKAPATPLRAIASSSRQEAVSDTPSTSTVEKLAKKVSELNVAPNRESIGERPNNLHGSSNGRTAPHNNRLPGSGSHLVQQNRRGRGNRRNYNQNYERNRVNVPNIDFDFASSNAKFNKEEIVKEVVKKVHNEHKEDETVQLDGPSGTPEEDIVIPPPQEYYDRSKSFFDNISCETKERLEQHGPDGRRNLSAQERRQKQSEERRLNMETFGQASIDGGRYRGGYRRGGYRSRGGYRGGRGGGGGAGSGGGYRGYNNFRGGYNRSMNPNS